MKDDKHFNIRVYALLINMNQEILVAEEYHFSTFMRKFPGGGLQFGESTTDCLRRELREELGIEVGRIEHQHTTDIFVQSAFNSNHQVIGVYYATVAPDYLISMYRENYAQPSTEGEERFRWIPLEKIGIDDFTFLIDRQAIEIFINKFKDDPI